MVDLSLLSPHAVSVPEPQAWRGIVARDAASIADEVYVTIPALEEETGDKLLHGPCKWEPHSEQSGIFYPKRGDSCAVVLTEDDDPWLAAWQPTTGIPDKPFEGGGKDSNYIHEQPVAAKEWVINHNLGKIPSVTVFDSTSRDVDCEVEVVDNNTLKLRFNAAISGKAVLN